MRTILVTFLGLAAGGLLTAQAQTKTDALLVVAHGASKGDWNQRVIAIVEQVDWPGPKGVAFLMPAAPEQELEKAAARLDQTGVENIVVLPLLISSFSDHYEEIRYYVGDRKDVPHHAHGEVLHTRARLTMAKAMDADHLVSRILAAQARSGSRDPQRESVVLVAHGPNDDADNQKWLACLKVHAAALQAAGGFRRVDFATIRDDAPAEVKDAAVGLLRQIVESNAQDSKVLIQPVLISVGHVQAEIATLLKGLEFSMSPSGVSTHPLAAEWIRKQAAQQLESVRQTQAIAAPAQAH